MQYDTENDTNANAIAALEIAVALLEHTAPGQKHVLGAARDSIKGDISAARKARELLAELIKQYD